MRVAGFLIPVFLLGVLSTEVRADCQVADAKLEEAILQKPELRARTSRQIVRDLRSLRDAAATLRTYGLDGECERLVANIRQILASPSIGALGDNDEDAADAQITAQKPQIQRGATEGTRSARDAPPLVRIDDLATSLRADEIIGAEVRSSDDKIVGEVRNIVLGTKDHPSYAVVASAGFFKPGKDSIVVPIRALKVSDKRDAYFLPLREADMAAVPLMPDQNYKWLSDQSWRTRNDAAFMR